MPRLKAPIPPASPADIFLATDPTRWELLGEAAGTGPFLATRTCRIAQRSATFTGGDTAARDQAERLVDAEVLKRLQIGNRLAYGADLKGKAIYARVLQLQHSRPFRTPAETHLLALIARLTDADYDAFEFGDRVELDLIADLRGRAEQSARIERRIHISDE